MNNSTSTDEPSGSRVNYDEVGQKMAVKRITPPPSYVIELGNTVAQLTKAQLIQLRDKIESILVAEYTDPIIATSILVAASHFSVPVEGLLSPRRTDRHVRARNYAIQVCHDLGCRNISALGRAFNRDDGTIRHALSRNKDRLAIYPDMRRELAFLRDRVEEKLTKGQQNATEVYQRGADPEKD